MTDKKPNIIFNDDDQFFTIAHSGWHASYASVSTPEKLIKCIYHLCQKGDWVTKELIIEFMLGCSKRFGYSVVPYMAY